MFVLWLLLLTNKFVSCAHKIQAVYLFRLQGFVPESGIFQIYSSDMFVVPTGEIISWSIIGCFHVTLWHWLAAGSTWKKGFNSAIWPIKQKKQEFVWTQIQSSLSIFLKLSKTFIIIFLENFKLSAKTHHSDMKKEN